MHNQNKFDRKGIHLNLEHAKRVHATINKFLGMPHWKGGNAFWVIAFCNINFAAVLVKMLSLLQINWTKKIAQILHWFGLHDMVMIEHNYDWNVNIEDKDLGEGKKCSIHVWWGVKLNHCLLYFEKHMKGLWQRK
jgi:hypothetical protein